MSKAIRAVLFDLDGTLLENDMDRFLKGYFGLLTPHMAHLVSPDRLVSALIHATYAMIQNGDPAVTNRQAFIDDFFPMIGLKPEGFPLFDCQEQIELSGFLAHELSAFLFISEGQLRDRR